MIEDKYLKSCKKAYALKEAEMKKGKLENDFLEYVHLQMMAKDIAKLNKVVELELRKVSGESLKGRVLKVKHGRMRLPTDREVDNSWVESRISKLKEDSYDADDWSREVSHILANFPAIFGKFHAALLDVLSKNQNGMSKKTDFQKNLEQFSKVFNLSKKEMDIITFLYLDRVDSEVDDYFTNRTKDLSNVARSMRYFCRFFNLKSDELRKIFSKENPLMKAGIIKKGKREDSLALSENVVSYLGGLSKDSLEDDYVKEAKLSEVIDLKDHNVNQDKIQTITHLLESQIGSNILLYGHPGTGKTEFAKALAKATGKRIYFINQADEDGEESLTFRKQAIVAAHNIIAEEDSIIVVDECDTILNIYDGMWKCETKDSSDRKAWINDFLEGTKHKFIWISNKVEGIDESTRRRFSYSLEFQPLSAAQRKKVWETQVKKQKVNFISENEISELAKNLKVNSGGITLALKDIQAMTSLKSKEQKLEVLKTILSQHQAFTSGEEAGLMQKSSKYSLEILNTDFALEGILQNAQRFFGDRKSFRTKGIHNINLLLQGPPGTGKTEFVKHLAEVTERELISKRASDIRSKWYGESVKNIAAAFKEAKENNAILFFDEADSFFGSRESSSEYHAEETNEFLTQMENFEGLMVCATNFTQRLDQASMRRFNYKVKFDYLKESAKVDLFKKYFSDLSTDGLDSSLRERLGKIPGLTPGDFKMVYQKNAFFEGRSAPELISQLEAEVSYKKEFTKKVGLS